MHFTRGNILEAEAEALVNTVNCVGIMGRGVALQFKDKFPANFKAYAAACKRGEVVPGRMFVFETGELTPPRYIINFPTKRHWRGKSRMEDIDSGLSALVAEIRARRIRSVAIPPLGSGLGGLDWIAVRSRIQAAFAALPEVDVLVYEPGGTPVDLKPNLSTNVPKMTPGRASLVALIDGYLAALLDPVISLLEVHKLMFFLQESGEPLRLRYVKAPYGPYSENLRHVLRDVEGHLIAGYRDGVDAPGKQLTLVPGASEEARRFLHDHAETQERLHRLAALVEGFETSFGLELLSTVYWVVSREGVSEADDVVSSTYAWNERKRQFSRDQITLALGRLQDHRWLP